MKNYNLNNDVEIMEKLKISPSQLILLKMLNEAEEDRKCLYYISNKLSKLKSIDWSEVADLISREIVIDHNSTDFTKPSNLYFDYMEINPKFLKQFKIPVIKAKELIKIYPRLLEINGRNYNLVNIGYLDLAEIYEENLNLTDFLHEEVVELINWGKENDQINLGLEKFTKTQFWVLLKELKNRGGGKGSSIKIEML